MLTELVECTEDILAENHCLFRSLSISTLTHASMALSVNVVKHMIEASARLGVQQKPVLVVKYNASLCASLTPFSPC